MNAQDQDLNDGEETIVLNAADALSTAEDRGDVVADAPAASNARPAAASEPAASGAEPDAETDAAGQHIPKARFDAVYAQRKDFQRRAEEAEAELDRILSSGARGASPAAAHEHAAFDDAAAEAAYFEAMMDGDQAKAVQIRREINAQLQQQAMAEYGARQAAQSTLEALDAASTSALAAHPWLDTEAGEEALEAIVALRDRKIASGAPAHLALAQAVAAIAPRFAPEGATPREGSPGAGQIADTRSRRSLIRGAAAAENQPPAIQAGLGNRTTASRVDVQNLTEDQFDALTPAELKKLRGD
jgi:hypothetical protein